MSRLQQVAAFRTAMPAENECHLPAATSRHIGDSRHSFTAATAAQPPQPRSRQAAAISDNTRNLPAMIEMKSKKWYKALSTKGTTRGSFPLSGDQTRYPVGDVRVRLAGYNPNGRKSNKVKDLQHKGKASEV